MAEVKIYYINMDDSLARRKAMESSFKKDSLIRISALNGFYWSDGFQEDNNKYKWKSYIYKIFKENGILASVKTNFINLTPPEVACNFSHIRALRTFLKTNDKYAIILEDDVEPIDPNISIAASVSLPLEGEILYLCGPNHPGDRIQLYKDSQVKWARTLMGYVVSRKAAKAMIEAAFPMCYLMDTQIMVRLYKSLEQYRNNWLDSEIEELQRFKAYGMFNPLIRHSHLAKQTTFTKDGTKPWLPQKAQI